MKRQADKLEHNAAAIKRWRSRLKRAMSMLDRLEKQRKRLEATSVKAASMPSSPPETRPRGHALISDLTTLMPAIQEALVDSKKAEPDLGIPDFLNRKLDPVAAQIKSEQEETKRAKARGRIEKMKAKQRGDLKKMPLTGKAALDAIRNG